MPTTLGKYTLGRELGSGVSCKVKLAKDGNDSRFAIKILRQDQNFDELVQTEVDTLTRLQHPNIVQLVEVGQGTQCHSRKGEKAVKYIVLELVSGGELFDFIALGGALTEETARFYYAQILSGLGYMHAQGFVHRDLKPENIMLDRSFNVKIADFGFAAPSMGRDGSGMLETQLGTASYMAPEIHEGKKYEGVPVDLFATAIILFVALTQRPPFAQAHPNDPHYAMIASGDRAQMNMFWQAHAEASGGEDIYSAEFKDLFEKMMSYDPTNRLSIQQLVDHQWMQGPTASPEAIVEEFKQRKALVDEDAHTQRESKRQERTRAKDNVHRSSAIDGEENASTAWITTDELKTLEIPEYDTYVEKQTRFFTTGNPYDYTLVLANHLKAAAGGNAEGIKISESTLKLSFETELVEVPDEDDEESKEEPEATKEPLKVKCVARVFVCKDEKNANKHCVDFTYTHVDTKKPVRDDRMTDNFLKFRDDIEELAPWFDDDFVF